jgi:hypothetical protein
MSASIFVLVLFGQVALPPPPHDAFTSMFTSRELKTFQFDDKDNCNNAARLMFKAREVTEAICIEVRP